MTVHLCIRQGLTRNYDSVSVEELDWSAESQVLIPAEHLWCDFKCGPCDKTSSPNTNDLYIHYMDKSTGTPSLEEKKALSIRGNNEENINHVQKIVISTSVATRLKCMKWLYRYVQSSLCKVSMVVNGHLLDNCQVSSLPHDCVAYRTRLRDHLKAFAGVLS